MTNIILNGCFGKMGRMVAEIVAEDPGIEIVAGVDTAARPNDCTFPVYDDIEEVSQEADVVVDFSNPLALDGLLKYCGRRMLPLVLCTTGYTEVQREKIKDAAYNDIPILISSNMSIGMSLMKKILVSITNMMVNAGFDIEIVEKHHNRKLDAPSGTAIMLADVMNASMNQGSKYELVVGRSGSKKRGNAEIGISSVRGGTIVGDHDIIFAGTDEVITISHHAQSRALFAKGAVTAAKYMGEINARIDCGIYTMDDVLDG